MCGGGGEEMETERDGRGERWGRGTGSHGRQYYINPTS